MSEEKKKIEWIEDQHYKYKTDIRFQVSQNTSSIFLLAKTRRCSKLFFMHRLPSEIIEMVAKFIVPSLTHLSAKVAEVEADYYLYSTAVSNSRQNFLQSCGNFQKMAAAIGSDYIPAVKEDGTIYRRHLNTTIRRLSTHHEIELRQLGISTDDPHLDELFEASDYMSNFFKMVGRLSSSTLAYMSRYVPIAAVAKIAELQFYDDVEFYTKEEMPFILRLKWFRGLPENIQQYLKEHEDLEVLLCPSKKSHFKSVRKLKQLPNRTH